MCGVAGYLSPDSERSRRALARMLDAMRHRGPDGVGQHTVQNAGPALTLGHRRLALIDLSPTGAQPMLHAETGNVIVFNGEIYDFQKLKARFVASGEVFQGTSDTEVLLVALTRLGEGILREIDGMFALAFYEARTNRLLLARDPCGIKPLVVAESTDGDLAFASEVRALAASGIASKAVDPEALSDVLAYGSTSEPRTLFKDIRMFPAGTARWIDVATRRTLSSTKLWIPPGEIPRVSAEEAAERLQAALASAVASHLVADVPVSIFLSSGMDSAVLAGLVARASHEVLALTVGFEGEQSEVDGARRTAHRLGVRHEVLQLDDAFVRRSFAEWLTALDQPSADGYNTFLVSDAVHIRGFKIAVSGLGADELWGGYATFRTLPRLASWLEPVPSPLRKGLGFLAKAGLGMRYGAFRSEKVEDLFSSAGSIDELYFAQRRILSKRRLAAAGLAPTEARWFPDVKQRGARLSLLERDFYMRNTLLRDADNMSMARGLEIRVPFLSRPILDLAASLPEEVRFPPGGRRKEMLWRAFESSIPPEEAALAKRGFQLPFASWFDGPVLSDWVRASLNSLKRRASFSDDAFNALTGQLDQPGFDHSGGRRLALSVLGDYMERHELHY